MSKTVKYELHEIGDWKGNLWSDINGQPRPISTHRTLKAADRRAKSEMHHNSQLPNGYTGRYIIKKIDPDGDITILQYDRAYDDWI